MTLRTLACVGLTTICSLGCSDTVESPDPIATGAESELEGTWELVSYEKDGVKAQLEASTQAVFTGDRFVVQRGDKVVAAGTFKTVPDTSPKHTDGTYTDGPDNGQSYQGIYQLEGDALTFCRPVQLDSARPSEFNSSAGSGQVVMVYKRAHN